MSLREIWTAKAAAKSWNCFKCMEKDGQFAVITHDSRIARMAERQFQIVDGVLSGGDSENEILSYISIERIAVPKVTSILILIAVVRSL